MPSPAHLNTMSGSYGARKAHMSTSALPPIAETDVFSPDLTPKLRDRVTDPAFVHKTATYKNESERIYLTFE